MRTEHRIGGQATALATLVLVTSCSHPCETQTPLVSGATNTQRDRVIDLFHAFQLWTGDQSICIREVDFQDKRPLTPAAQSHLAIYRYTERRVIIYQHDHVPDADELDRRILHELCHAFDRQLGFDVSHSPLWDKPTGDDPLPYRRRENFAALCEGGELAWQIRHMSEDCNGIDQRQLEALDSVFLGSRLPMPLNLPEPLTLAPPNDPWLTSVNVQLYDGLLVVDWLALRDEELYRAARVFVDPATASPVQRDAPPLPLSQDTSGYTTAPLLDLMAPSTQVLSAASHAGSLAHVVRQRAPDGPSALNVVVHRADDVEVLACVEEMRVLGDEDGLWLVKQDIQELRWWRLQ